MAFNAGAGNGNRQICGVCRGEGDGAVAAARSGWLESHIKGVFCYQIAGDECRSRTEVEVVGGNGERSVGVDADVVGERIGADGQRQGASRADAHSAEVQIFLAGGDGGLSRNDLDGEVIEIKVELIVRKIFDGYKFCVGGQHCFVILNGGAGGGLSFPVEGCGIDVVNTDTGVMACST